MSDILTCICCRTTFDTPQNQRDHYRSDYHRFNLKRKVVNLPPVSEELFLQKVKEIKEKQTTKEIFTGYCTFCKKKFSNQQTYNGHIKSKKHLEKERKARSISSNDNLKGTNVTITKQAIDQPIEEIKKEEIENNDYYQTNAKTEEEFIQEKLKNAYKFQLTECLICKQISDKFEINIEHMAKVHGLYIPDLDFVTDIEGLISYLGEKIGTGNACLYCDRIFKDTEAVQNHMKSLIHSKLKYDDESMDEYEEFYDFSKTWENIEDDNNDIDENEEITEEQELQLMIQSGKGIIGVDEDGYSLTLANGKSIGHRDLFIYYKQNYNRLLSRNPESKKRVLNTYKTLGWKTQLGKKERSAQRKQANRYYKENMQVGVKSNRLQKFFREQVLY